MDSLISALLPVPRFFTLRTSDARSFGILFLIWVGLGVAGAAQLPALQSQPTGRLPVSVVANQGQLPAEVLFHTRIEGHQIFFLEDQVAFYALNADHVADDATDDTAEPMRLRFGTGRSPGPGHRPVGIEPLPGVANFYLGKSIQISGAPTFGGVAYSEILPGIELRFLTTDGQLKSELVVSPGADPSQIRLRYSGVNGMSLSAAGELILTHPSGQWTEGVPVVFQDIGGQAIPVAGAYRLLPDGAVTFELGEFDSEHTLIIDPTLSYATFLGGDGVGDAGADIVNDLVLDSARNIIVVGQTRSTTFPLMNPLQPSKAGPADASESAVDLFVTQLDPTLSFVLWSTYIGGRCRELSPNVAIDVSGNVYVSAWTVSDDFPTTAGVIGPGPLGVSCGGDITSGTRDDAVVFKLTPEGALVYSTYLGGSGDDEPGDIAVDGDGRVYVGGTTSSLMSPGRFPTTNDAVQAGPASPAGVWDVFVTRLSSDAQTIEYSTFLGGDGLERATALGLEGDAVYVAGSTLSTNFPVTSTNMLPLQPTYGGSADGFVARIEPSTAGPSGLIYSTYLGGLEEDFITAIDVREGMVYLTGSTASSNFPAALPALSTSHLGGLTDAFVSVLGPEGESLVCSTFLGGTGAELGKRIAVNLAGQIDVTGVTNSTDFPTRPLMPKFGQTDAFLTRFEPGCGLLVSSVYVGGSLADSGNGLAVANSHHLAVGGQTQSSDFSTTAAAFQPVYGGGTADGFVSVFEPVFVGGFAVSPLGAAQLSASGVLAVSNLGSSGDDGVRIELGGVDGVHTILNIDADALNEGAELEAVLQGMAEGQFARLGGLKVRAEANDFSIEPDFGVGVTYRLSLFLEGLPVAVRSGLSGIAGNVQLSSSIDQVIELFDNGSVTVSGWHVPTGFRLPSGQVIDADEAVFTAEGPALSGDVLSSIEWTANDIAEFQINELSMVHQGRRHEVLGEAHFEPAEDQLRLSNLGEITRATQNGTDIMMHPASGWSLSLNDLQKMGVGDVSHVETIGEVNGVAGEPVVEIHLEKFAAEQALGFGFHPSPSTYRIQLPNGSVIASGATGREAFFNVNELRLTVQTDSILGPLVTVNFNSGITVRLANGTSHQSVTSLLISQDSNPIPVARVLSKARVTSSGAGGRVFSKLAVTLLQELTTTTASNVNVMKHLCYQAGTEPLKFDIDLCVNKPITANPVHITIQEELSGQSTFSPGPPSGVLLPPENSICRIGMHGVFHGESYTSLVTSTELREDSGSPLELLAAGFIEKASKVFEIPACSTNSSPCAGVPLCDPDPDSVILIDNFDDGTLDKWGQVVQ